MKRWNAEILKVMEDLCVDAPTVWTEFKPGSYCWLYLPQFEEALSAPNPTEALDELIDPSLRGDYPVDSALKVSSREVSSSASVCFSSKSNMICIDMCYGLIDFWTRLRPLQSPARMRSPGWGLPWDPSSLPWWRSQPTPIFATWTTTLSEDRLTGPSVKM